MRFASPDVRTYDHFGDHMGLGVTLSAPVPVPDEPAALRRWPEADRFTELTGLHIADVTHLLHHLAGSDAFQWAAQLTWAALESGRSVVTVGNGGGAATASHCAADLAAAIADCPDPANCGQVRSLASDCATVTALANDFGVDDIFARQVRSAVRPGDVLLCFSVSGRSTNVLRACAQARAEGGTSIAFVGRAPAAPHAIDLCVELPGVFYGSIEDAQQCAAHMLAAFVHGTHAATHRRVG